MKEMFLSKLSFFSLATVDSLPFKFTEKDFSKIESTGGNGLFNGIIGDLGQLASPLYSWGIKIITITFVLATVVMILSALFKNGQWQKYAQTAITMSFVSLLVLRGLPILILSVRHTDDIDLLFQDALSMLGFSVIFLCLISFAVSFLFSFGYKLIEHPEFHRWSKTLRSVSVMMLLFAIVIPWLFPII